MNITQIRVRKYVLISFLFFISATTLHADTLAVTIPDNDTVVLKKDGTWSYKQANQESSEPLKKDNKKLPQIFDLIKKGQITTDITWQSSFVTSGKSDGESVYSIQEAKNSFYKLLHEDTDVPYLKRYSASISSFFDNAPKVTGQFSPKLLSSITPFSSFDFGTRNNSDPCLFLPNIGVRAIFNTLQTNSKDRAIRVTKTTSIPFLKTMANEFEETEVNCLGVGVAYGSRNFLSDNKILSTKTEYIAVLGNKSEFIKFAEGRITEERLLQSLTAFNKSRDMTSGVKKINLKR